MISITIDGFITKIAKSNKELDKIKLKKDLLDAAKRKKNGCKCMICGNPIWAAGSALSEWNGCFSCISGETDDSNDYEINIATIQEKANL